MRVPERAVPALCPDQGPALLALPAAAAFLGVPPWTLREWVTAGVVPRVRVPLPVTAKRRGGEYRRILIARATLVALVTRWAAEAPQEPA